MQPSRMTNKMRHPETIQSRTREERRALSQTDAAKYLGVSVRWFRDHAEIEPIPFGPIAAHKRPLMRYLKEDLDTLIARWASRRRA